MSRSRFLLSRLLPSASWSSSVMAGASSLSFPGFKGFGFAFEAQSGFLCDTDDPGAHTAPLSPSRWSMQGTLWRLAVRAVESLQLALGPRAPGLLGSQPPFCGTASFSRFSLHHLLKPHPACLVAHQLSSASAGTVSRYQNPAENPAVVL